MKTVTLRYRFAITAFAIVLIAPQVRGRTTEVDPAAAFERLKTLQGPLAQAAGAGHDDTMATMKSKQ